MIGTLNQKYIVRMSEVVQVIDGLAFTDIPSLERIVDIVVNPYNLLSIAIHLDSHELETTEDNVLNVIQYMYLKGQILCLA